MYMQVQFLSEFTKDLRKLQDVKKKYHIKTY